MDKFETMTDKELSLIDNAEKRVEKELNKAETSHPQGDTLIKALELIDHLEAHKIKLEQRDQHREETQISDRVASFITKVAGSMPFLVIHASIFVLWIVGNLSAKFFGFAAFDPYPFGMLTTAVSLEAILLSTFILITQNRQARQDQRRDEVDFERDRLDLKVDTVSAINTREATVRIANMERELHEINAKLELLTRQIKPAEKKAAKRRK